MCINARKRRRIIYSEQTRPYTHIYSVRGGGGVGRASARLHCVFIGFTADIPYPGLRLYTRDRKSGSSEGSFRRRLFRWAFAPAGSFSPFYSELRFVTAAGLALSERETYDTPKAPLLRARQLRENVHAAANCVWDTGEAKPINAVRSECKSRWLMSFVFTLCCCSCMAAAVRGQWEIRCYSLVVQSADIGLPLCLRISFNLQLIVLF